MSNLESKTKPIITALLDSTVTEINPAAQQTLTIWAVKTAMVLEALDPNRVWFYSEAERDRIRTEREIPARTAVYLAKCVDQSDIHSTANVFSTRPRNYSAKAFVVTMAFGSLALQVVTLRTPATVHPSTAVTYDTSEGPWDKVLVQVWPPERASPTWPPAMGLRGDWGIDALTTRLSSPA
jgi:hypothetical protein